MPFKPRTLRGQIHHMRGDEQFGRENFSMSVFDKGRVIRSAIEFDDLKVLRDATWSVDAQWKPQECFFRELIDGELIAHHWWKVAGTQVDCEAWTKQMGRVSQVFERGAEVQTFSLHTLMSDVFATVARGVDAPGVERLVTGVNNSIGHYGTAHYYAMPHAPMVTFAGYEMLTVPAGTFEAALFKIRWSEKMVEPCDYYVMKDHFIPLQLRGSYEASIVYHLAQFEEL
jgi:hypothetical protein